MTDQSAHIVGEECVEANVSEAELVVAAAELLLPIRAKREECMIASHRVLPGVLQRRGRRRQTGGEGHGHSAPLGCNHTSQMEKMLFIRSSFRRSYALTLGDTIRPA